MLFHIYAPNELNAAECVAKIDEDFHGALPYLQQHCGAWTFVHNARGYLDRQITQKLLELAWAHRQIAIDLWGYVELRHEVMSLDDNDIESLFGPPLTRRSMMEPLELKDVAEVLDEIALLPAVQEPGPRPVPSRPESKPQNSSLPLTAAVDHDRAVAPVAPVPKLGAHEDSELLPGQP